MPMDPAYRTVSPDDFPAMLEVVAGTATRGVETDTLSSIRGAIGSSAADTFRSDGSPNWFQGAGGRGHIQWKLNALEDVDIVMMLRLQTERPAGTLARISQPFAGHDRLGRWLALAMLPVLALAAWATVDTLLLHPGLAQLTNASTLIPAGVLALDEAVVVADTGSRWAFTAATLLGLFAMATWLRGTTLSDRRTPPQGAGWLLAGAGFVVGTVLIQWGLRLGMPMCSSDLGGALHVFGGGMTLLFAALMAGALRRQAWGWAREWSWFLMACLLATPGLWWALPAVGALGVPQEYIQTGHAWRLAAYGQWMPLIGAFLCAIHSEATHAKLAR